MISKFFIIIEEIKKHEKELIQYAKDHPVAIDHVKFDDHSDLRGDMDTQRSMYSDMKKDFFDFVSKSM